jgi:hypothetical protein
MALLPLRLAPNRDTEVIPHYRQAHDPAVARLHSLARARSPHEQMSSGDPAVASRQGDTCDLSHGGRLLGSHAAEKKSTRPASSFIRPRCIGVPMFSVGCRQCSSTFRGGDMSRAGLQCCDTACARHCRAVPHPLEETEQTAHCIALLDIACIVSCN